MDETFIFSSFDVGFASPSVSSYDIFISLVKRGAKAVPPL